jgi:amidase
VNNGPFDIRCDASAVNLASWVKSGEVSPVELMQMTLKAIERDNAGIKAFVHLAAEDALRRAKEQEAALLRGEEIGPLGGVPVAMKDLYDFKIGWPSTLGGIPALRNNIATFNSLWVDRMEKAGAIIVGKTNAASLGFRGTCDNVLFGVSNNPFDTRYNSGGSSGGSAAAVASGLISIGQATDGGGSTRIPAAFCGLVGLKPTFGRIPLPIRPNAFGGVSPFLSDGVVTRTVEDTVLALGILEGFDSRDPFVSRGPKVESADIDGKVAGLRIAYSPNLDSYPIESEVRQAIVRALRVLQDAGALIEEVRLGFSVDHYELGELWCRLIVHSQIETLDYLKSRGIDIFWDHASDLGPIHHRWINEVLSASTRNSIDDQRMRTMVYGAIQSCLDCHDLLVTPTTACVGIPNNASGDTIGPSVINDVKVEPLLGWALTSHFNLTGHPAISVPVGLSSGGIPIGMQIVGNRFDDVAVINAALFIEQAMPWSAIYERVRQRD